MPTFMILGKYTEQGARSIKDSPKREGRTPRRYERSPRQKTEAALARIA